jgi:hypothetical protein
MKSAPHFPVSALLLVCIAAGLASAQTTAPTTSVGSTSAVQTATLTFIENPTVASINVLTQGAPKLDFQLASGGTCAEGASYTKGQTCTVSYTFRPTHPGIRYGAVALYDNASPANAVATTYVKGTGDGPQVTFIPAMESALNSRASSGAIAVDGSGNIFFASTAVYEIVAAGGYTTVKVLESGTLQGASGIAVDGAGNVFVASNASEEVVEIVAAGGYTRIVTIADATSIPYPWAIAVDGSGNLFVADKQSNLVKEILASGGYATAKTLGSGFSQPDAVAVDGNNNVFVADFGSGFIKEIVAAGGYTTVREIGSQLNHPQNVAVDGYGNVFVAVNPTSYRGYIKEFPAQGGYTTTKIVTQLSTVQYALALDGSGNIFLTSCAGYNSSDCEVNELNYTNVPALSFAETQVGSTSTDSPETVTVGNNGNQTLKLSGVSYPTDYPQKNGVVTDCTSSTDLTPGATCTLSIDFSPLVSSATGLTTPLNEEVVVTDNSLNVTDATQSVAAKSYAIFTPPALITPTPGTTIGASSATFTWNPGSATTFQFRLGTTLGSNNIYGSGQTNATSATVSNLPTGVNIYAVLYYMLDGAWKSLDYTYPGTPQAPKLTTPTPGSTLSGSTVTFTWNPGTATTFQFRLGTTLGSNNIYGSGQTTKTSVTVSNLPTNGETIHAVLYYMVNGAWQYTDYTYTAQ